VLFVEPRFFLFFAIVLTAYWSLRSNNDRKLLLLGASYFFYGCWDWRFAGMLLAISVADYFFALRIYQTSSQRARKLFVTLSLAMNLSVLGFFKYFHFFAGSAVSVANSLHLHLDQPTIQIILPVGVSFFTFQSLSYTIDVYRGEIPPAPTLRDYLTFAAFFPQLVAGPIVRPRYFLPQLESCRTISVDDVKQMLYLFLIGYIKKACIADNISPMVDRYFQQPAGFNHASAIIAVWLYATQIFCDFSGYSDMAIAAAGLMGYKLVLNFDAPYLAVSIQDFWRRWHISLSTWIRDYIYFSLGGNRGKTRAFKYRNLVLTMLAGGLWHGAAWTFVVWGGSHGAAQVVHAEVQHQLPAHPHHEPWRRVAGWFLTLQFVCMAWILFRSTSFAQAGFVTRQYLGLAGYGGQSLQLWLLVLPPALLLSQAIMRRTRMGERLCSGSLALFAMVYGAAWALAIAMLPLGYRPFIYFQF
jgi:alginate O-acetyltransferase complex protein AlgI